MLASLINKTSFLALIQLTAMFLGKLYMAKGQHTQTLPVFSRRAQQTPIWCYLPPL